MSLVYEVLDQFGFRALIVEKEEIARELCLSSKYELSYRPVYVAEDFGGAKMTLRQLEKEGRLL